MGIIISTVNMKGGVGKTTLTVNLATCLAKNHHKKVLVLDLDSQISATLSLISPQEFGKIRKTRHTLSNLLDQIIKPNIKHQFPIQELVINQLCGIDNLSLIPGDIELYDEYLVSEMLYEQALTRQETNFAKVWNNFERILIQKILAPIKDDYDFIILDCAPGYNLLTRSGIAASNLYLLPARPEPLSLVGIQLLERRIAKLKEAHQNTAPLQLKLLGIVFILSGGGLLGRYYNQVMKRVKSDFSPSELFENNIPMDVNVAKAVDGFMPVVLATPSSSGAKAFVKLSEEFLDKLTKL